MKSLILIFIIYVGLFIYGQNISNPFIGEKETSDAITFHQNTLSIFRKNGDKIASLHCSELITDNKTYQANTATFQVFSFPKNKTNEGFQVSQKKSNFESPQEDFFVDARQAIFISKNDPISFKKNVKMTYGTETFLETDECFWEPKTENLFFPKSVSIQSGNNFIQGENAIIDTQSKTAIIESNIISFFLITNTSDTNHTIIKKEKLTKLTSAGPLLFNNSFKTISFPNPTTITNSDLTLTADKIEFFFNSENKIQHLKAEGNVNVQIHHKNVKAWSPKATIDFDDKNFYFMEKDKISPYIEMNGFRQTASYLTYNETTEILKAGPEVNSIKILPDAKE
jgi:lipopolysaccharide export system protein LptA